MSARKIQPLGEAYKGTLFPSAGFIRRETATARGLFRQAQQHALVVF